MKNYVFSVLVFLFASSILQAELVVCDDVPTNVQVQRHSDGLATLNATNSSGYVDIFVRPAEGSAPGGGPNHGLENLSLPTTSAALLPQFDYDIWVRTNCGGGEYSEWVGPFRIATYDEFCADPTDIEILRTSDTTASLSATGTCDFYIVPDGDPGPADIWTGPNAFGGNDQVSPYMRADLDPYTSYDVYVRSQCNVTQVTEWMGPYDLDAMSCPEPVVADIVLTRTSPTTGLFEGADPAYVYQGSANRAGRPLRARPMYGMTAMVLPHTQTGLVPAFDYDVWFRTDCGDELYSDWVGPVYLPTYGVPMKVSPNPTTGPVKFEGSDITSVQVFNMSGTLEMTSKVSNNEVNLQNLSPGQYIIQTTDARGNVSSTKLMKR